MTSIIYASEVVLIKNIMYQNQSFYKTDNFQNKQKTKSSIETFNADLFNDVINMTREMNWKMAKQYCQNLEYQGFFDWRLPTHQELENLSRVNIYYALGNYQSFDEYAKQHLDNAKAHVLSIKVHRKKSKIGSELIVKKDFLEKMPLINNQNPMGDFWVSDERDQRYAMTLDLRNAIGGWVKKTRNAYVLCVRKK